MRGRQVNLFQSANDRQKAKYLIHLTVYYNSSTCMLFTEVYFLAPVLFEWIGGRGGHWSTERLKCNTMAGAEELPPAHQP